MQDAGDEGKGEESVSPSTWTESGVEVVPPKENWGCHQKKREWMLRMQKLQMPPYESLIHSKQELLEENPPVLLLQEYDLVIRGNL